MWPRSLCITLVLLVSSAAISKVKGSVENEKESSDGVVSDAKCSTFGDLPSVESVIEGAKDVDALLKNVTELVAAVSSGESAKQMIESLSKAFDLMSSAGGRGFLKAFSASKLFAWDNIRQEYTKKYESVTGTLKNIKETAKQIHAQLDKLDDVMQKLRGSGFQEPFSDVFRKKRFSIDFEIYFYYQRFFERFNWESARSFMSHCKRYNQLEIIMWVEMSLFSQLSRDGLSAEIAKAVDQKEIDSMLMKVTSLTVHAYMAGHACANLVFRDQTDIPPMSLTDSAKAAFRNIQDTLEIRTKCLGPKIKQCGREHISNEIKNERKEASVDETVDHLVFDLENKFSSHSWKIMEFGETTSERELFLSDNVISYKDDRGREFVAVMVASANESSNNRYEMDKKFRGLARDGDGVFDIIVNVDDGTDKSDCKRVVDKVIGEMARGATGIILNFLGCFDTTIPVTTSYNWPTQGKKSNVKVGFATGKGDYRYAKYLVLMA